MVAPVAIGPTTSLDAVSLPSGVVAGDLLLTAILEGDTQNVPATPAGWSLLDSAKTAAALATNNRRLTVFYRVATATEPASYNFTAASQRRSVMFAYRDVAANPIRTYGVDSQTTYGKVGGPSVYAYKDDLAVLIGAVNDGAASNFTPSSSGLVEHFDTASNGEQEAFFVGGKLISATGNTGRLEAAHNGGADQAARGFTVLLKQANRVPNAPTLTTMASGGTVAAGDVNRAAHSHSDPDGDGQSAFDLRYRLVGAATWTTVFRSTTSQFYDFPASSLAVGNYERQVRTASLNPDTGATVWGPFSASGFFTVAARTAGPTFTAPINGQAISAATVDVTVSASSFDTFELRVLDAAGAVLIPVTSSATGFFGAVGPLDNSQTVTLQARTVLDTLAGEWTSISNPVSYTTPDRPSLRLYVGPSFIRLVPAFGATADPNDEGYFEDAYYDPAYFK